VKSAGFDESVFEGRARVFNGERAAMDALEACRIVPAGLGENIGDYAALAVAGGIAQ
jgi:hypothetical protein